jgi:hypothetical protein
MGFLTIRPAVVRKTALVSVYLTKNLDTLQVGTGGGGKITLLECRCIY